MTPHHLSSLCMALLFASACFSAPARSDDDDWSDLDPAAQQGGSHCRGAVWECYHLDDISSCSYQKGCSWDLTIDDCNGHQTDCQDIAELGVCIRQIGCEWVDGSGQVESSLLEGDCVGDPVPCESYPDQGSCGPQPGCIWEYSAGCQVDYSKTSDGLGCSTWSVHDIHSDGHPEVMMARCEARDGCSWQGDVYSDEAGGIGGSGGSPPSMGGEPGGPGTPGP